LERSCLFLPLLSKAALETMRKGIFQPQKADNFLIELERASALRVGREVEIFPLFVGEVNAHTGYKRFSDVSVFSYFFSVFFFKLNFLKFKLKLFFFSFKIFFPLNLSIFSLFSIFFFFFFLFKFFKIFLNTLLTKLKLKFFTHIKLFSESFILYFSFLISSLPSVEWI
jgi:hypothetical protein